MEAKSNGTMIAKIFTRAPSLDWSFGVIWALAVMTVVGGAYWSGLVQYAEYVNPRAEFM